MPATERPKSVLEFTIPGEPVPKARARVLRSGHSYTPKATHQHETHIAIVAMKKRGVNVQPDGVGRYWVQMMFYASRRGDL